MSSSMTLWLIFFLFFSIEATENTTMMMHAEMAVNGSDSPIWQQIEFSESYLVSSMFEEAESLALSILKQLRSEAMEGEASQVREMLECASMVLLQSHHHLHRRSQILDELKQVFSSVESIPVKVLLTGACLQMSESSSVVGEFLEEFLGKWRSVDGRYVCGGEEAKKDYVEACGERLSMEVDEYLEVVELYVMKCLVTDHGDLDVAISWVEKAELPEDARQGLMRRLHSLYSAKATASATDNMKARSSNSEDIHLVEGDGDQALKGKQQAVLRLSKQVEPYFWWFRTVYFKFGKARVAVSNGKIVMGSLVLILSWIIRRKRISLKRVIERQALNLKKAVIDSWQLAFSYQMNPLAAVQPSAAQSRLR